MDRQNISILHLPTGKKARILSIQGGHGFQRKLQVMGIREGQVIKIVSRQPFRGPLTIEVCGSQITLGRGMTSKIIVEVM